MNSEKRPEGQRGESREEFERDRFGTAGASQSSEPQYVEKIQRTDEPVPTDSMGDPLIEAMLKNPKGGSYSPPAKLEAVSEPPTAALEPDWTIEQKLLDLYYRKKDGCEHKGAGRVCIDCVAEMVRAEAARASQAADGCKCVCHSYPQHGQLQDALEALKWHQDELIKARASVAPAADRRDELQLCYDVLINCDGNWRGVLDFIRRRIDDLEALAAPSVAPAAALLEMLRKLANEASGFLSMADIQTHGVTNIHCLQRRINEAREMLAAPATEGEKP